MKYTIYKTTNNVNNKIYIGKHQTNDLHDDYLGSGKLLQYSIEKYGRDKFTKEILFEFDTIEEMNQMESEIVDEIFIARLDTYNIKLGGDGGFDWINNNRSESHNRSLSEIGFTKKGNKSPNFGVKFSDEVKLKKSNAMKLYFENGGNKAFKGLKHSKESKQKIGKANSKHQKGKGNSMYGKRWISKSGKCKLIDGKDSNQWINDGWKFGKK